MTRYAQRFVVAFSAFSVQVVLHVNQVCKAVSIHWAFPKLLEIYCFYRTEMNPIKQLNENFHYFNLLCLIQLNCRLYYSYLITRSNLEVLR